MPILATVLNKYASKAKVFVESGTHIGGTVRVAINAGFKQIYTIELAKHFYDQAVVNFASNKNVFPIFGDSVKEIPKILAKVNQPCVFWLDGHWSKGDTARGPVDVPLYQELDAIKTHGLKGHTILIDDVRLMGAEWEDISLDVVKQKLLDINPKYKFVFENGWMPGENRILKNDILVAIV